MPSSPVNGRRVVQADVVIYGGTSAAIIAAVEVIRSGKSVVVVSPDLQLGGLTSGGLGYTDTGRKETIGGLSRDFYHRVWLHYQNDSAWRWQKSAEFGNKGQGTPAIDGQNRTMWLFEPHVAEQIFEDYIREYAIPVFRNEWLDREKGVILKKGRIVSITTLSGKEFTGKMFMDATYEGDLMAAAGVRFVTGRESNAEFSEQWNGVQKGAWHHRHNFLVLKEPVSAYKIPGDPGSGLLPLVSPDPPGENGSADHRVQAYCFRLCMTDHPANRIPFPRPANYDSTQYELLARVFERGWNEVFDKYDALPNRKTDTNNHGPVSSDYIGMNYDYPGASYAQRREIIRAHEEYQKGLLWFMSHDRRVPETIRDKMGAWGLAADEFTDHGGWPHQLYIRESRRMRGGYVMTENELTRRRPTPESIGMGSYTIDSHNVQRYIDENGNVQNEGDVGLELPGPYAIAYGSVVPTKEDCTNLLVPVCVSATHIAYGSIRMEPVFMILGQSAAVAACMAID
ncbi:MAG: FAD-dependent oxidoreductase, partial [Prolixibacteraceae bacterium]|nr:FAD-dependent oxidoreductase [Prolixibacteraceae bacterium]